MRCLATRTRRSPFWSVAAENAVEDFSLCQTRKSDYNYHVSEIDDHEVVSVIEAAESLAEHAPDRLRDKGWV